MGSNNVDAIYMNGLPDGMMWSKQVCAIKTIEAKGAMHSRMG
jgi:hypothetical protein